MSFRTLEISNAAEIHIKENQLKVTTEEGMEVTEPATANVERYGKTGV